MYRPDCIIPDHHMPNKEMYKADNLVNLHNFSVNCAENNTHTLFLGETIISFFLMYNFTHMQMYKFSFLWKGCAFFFLLLLLIFRKYN